MIRFLRLLILVFAVALPLAPVAAQDALVSAKAAGQVGERPDGLIGAVQPNPSAETRALVERINAERLRVYADTARRNNTTVEVTQRIFGERLVRDTPAGLYYMDAQGRWQRR